MAKNDQSFEFGGVGLGIRLLKELISSPKDLNKLKSGLKQTEAVIEKPVQTPAQAPSQAPAQEGFSNIEEVAYVPESELLAIEEFDAEIVSEIRRRARDALLTQLIAKEEILDQNAPEDDLLQLEGMTERLAFRLAEKGVRTQEELAGLSVDELKEIDEMTDEKAAGLIKAARAPWFAEET